MGSEMCIRDRAIGVAAAYGVALQALRLSQLLPPGRGKVGMGVDSVKDSTPSLSLPLQGGGDGLVDFNAGMETGFTVLAASRPTAVNLFWALQRMRKVWESVAAQTPQQIAQRLLVEAHEILAEDIRINKAMGTHGAALLKDGARVLTHCNAGALAACGYGSALGVIRAAVERGHKISVLADETRPYLQGARLTAWELMKDGIPTTVLCDNMSAHLMKKGRIQACIVGADRIAANGDTANKIGTYGVSILAKEHGIPFYVAAPWATLDLATAHGDLIPIEQRDAREVTHSNGKQMTPDGVGIENPAFDVTPARYITAIITERGILRAPFEESIAAMAKA